MILINIPPQLIYQKLLAVYTVIVRRYLCTYIADGGDMGEQEKGNAAVYVSWKTFLNSIELLSKAELPNVIDKTVFTGMAFSVQNQLFTGMRFLGLIDEKSRPTADLESVTGVDEAARKLKLKEIFQRKYAELFALNLKKTTPDELEKKMSESYGVRGDTCDRAVRFFVGAATYLGIEMSPLFGGKKTNGMSRGTGAKKRGPRKAVGSQNSGDAVPDSGTSKTVRLQSGGTLTLSATLDLFRLNSEDRKFVFELIDKLEGYVQPKEKEAAQAE
jgi:Family of unknown function (DUF5343)